MRDFKFRGWNLIDKVMVYDLNSIRLMHGILSPDDYIIEQYIGLCDKNGEEICEGDILKGFDEPYTTPFNAAVYWEEENAAFGIKTSNGGGAFLNELYLEHFGVIGNIHENPELLATKQKKV